MIVYLAGPIEGCSDKQAYTWRELTKECLAEFGIKCVVPERQVGDENITDRDRRHVATSDAVLMYLKGATRVSVGTMIEAGWADILGVPIFLVLDPGDLHDHHMLKEVVKSTHRSLLSAWRALQEEKDKYYSA